MKIISRVITFIFAIALVIVAKAQNTHIKGHITDDDTREPMSFVGFYSDSFFQQLLFLSDFEGNFKATISDTISKIYTDFSEYESLVIVTDSINNRFLNLQLKRKLIRMQGITITLKFNPALRLIKLAQANKDGLNPDKLEFYKCETYTKNIISVNNINDRIKQTKFGKELGNLFDTISYLSADGNKSILPVFVSEVLSDYYYNKTPRLTREEIKASQVKGVGVDDGTFISQVLGSTFVNYNFYANSLVVIDKGIPSPIGDLAMTIYNYKLVNVERYGGKKIFQIRCWPKQEKDLAFSGYLWIEDTTGALVRLSLELNGNSNLNFIEKLRITQEYKPVGDSYFYSKSRVVVDAKETSTNALGIVANNSISFKNIDITTRRPNSFYSERLIMNQGATTMNKEFWDSMRHVPATADELRIEKNIDTLLKLPSIKTYVDMANFLVDGYVNFNFIGIGPYYNLISYNQLEGLRIRLGFRTNPSLSKNWLIQGMGAYGLKDQRWKYSLMVERILNRKRWTKLGVSYKRDVEQIGITDNENLSGSLFSAFNLLGSNNLNLNTDRQIRFGTDLRTGMRFNLNFGNRHYEFEKVGNFNFAWYPYAGDTHTIWQSFSNTYLNVGFFYAPRNYYLQNDNRRVSFTNAGPIYYASYQRGIKGILNSNFNYDKAQLGFTYNKVWEAIGRTTFNMEGNATFGILPYPLQTVYIGNQSFVYNTSAYNQMRIFEFISDRSFSTSAEHHFNGFLLNRVPLIRRLKWRSIVGGKTIYGSLDKRNYDLIPKQYEGVNVSVFKALDKIPYAETSIGLENIFKIIRVDAVWRLTYRDINPVRNFGVKASISVGF